MSWFRIDDNLSRHRKAKRAGAAAMGLWVCCGAHASSAAGSGDGFIASEDVEDQATRLGIDGDWRAVAARLVNCGDELEDGSRGPGFWTEARGGYRFHDWSDYRPGSDPLAERRRADAERQAKAREEKRLREAEKKARKEQQKAAREQSHGPSRDASRDMSQDAGVTSHVMSRDSLDPARVDPARRISDPVPSRPDPPNPPRGGGASADPEIPVGAVELVWLRGLRLAGCSGIEHPRAQAIQEMAEHWQAADECGDTWDGFAARFGELIAEWVADIRRNGKQDYNRRWPWPAFAAWHDKSVHSSQAQPDDPWGDPDAAELAAGGHVQ